MGTNYYLYSDFCPCCGKPRRKTHLGKSSIGWKFLIHKTNKVFDYNSLCNFIEIGIIEDEYGDEWAVQDFIDLVNSHQDDKNHPDCESINGYNFLECDFS